jgi:hypothetical protein
MANRKRDLQRYLHGRGKGWKDPSKKSNKQLHTQMSQGFNVHHQVRPAVIMFDLHNHGLHQAKKRIKDECRYAPMDQTIQFCHGSNHGTQIRDFIRNGSLAQALQDLKINGVIWPMNDGNTYFNRLP